MPPAASSPASFRPRGRKPRLSRAEIVEVALEVIDEGGVAALNLRALAGRLGISPMGLYRYFDDKDELLDATAAHVLLAATSPAAADGPWDRALEAAMHDMRAALLEHPGIMELVARRFVGGELDAFRGRLFDIAEDAGWDERTTRNALRAVTSYVFGSVLVERRDGGDGTLDESFEFGLACLIDALRRA